jgi:hypothetical protein
MSQSQQELAAGEPELAVLPVDSAQRISEAPALSHLQTPKKKRGQRRQAASQSHDTQPFDIAGLKAEIRASVDEKRSRLPSNALLARRSEARSLSAARNSVKAGVSALDNNPDAQNVDDELAREQISSVDWLAIDASLTRVRQHVEIGGSVPELSRLKGPVRHAARLVAAVILLVSRFLTNRQSAFNIAGLTALHQLAEGIRRMHLSYAHQIQRLEKQLSQLRKQQEESTQARARSFKRASREDLKP